MLHLVAVLDGSGSIDNNEWSMINDYVRNFAGSFSFGPSGVRLL